jgi:hypothetical protein
MLKNDLINGYNYTLHPKPDDYSLSEWKHMVACYHTSKGHVVKDIKNYYDEHTDKNPMYPTILGTEVGMEVQWIPAKI